MNEWIVQNHPLHIFVTSQDHARELGATMLFGEKYGEHVRVVEIDECLPRAVRRHPRALDRGDRRVRAHPRDQLVPGRAPDRGDHRRRRRSSTCVSAPTLLNELVEAVAERDKEIKRLKQRSPRPPAAETNGSARRGWSRRPSSRAACA